MIRWVYYCTICLTVIALPARGLGDQRHEPARWAVLTADPLLSGGLSDLLTAELGQVDGVQLVERESIDRVLRELQLTAAALVEPARAMRFGRMAAAEAVVFVEPVAGTRPELLRLRVIETRTGVRLLDEFVPKAALDENVATLTDLLSA
ncbi:MAG: hypothetical protein H8E44_37515 [Planctomycetes bacterium]|nr:hypothetical protein [Planctomycetota bacterium]MBL7044603.1 hypothetical protein [Pirellulaceae bacterium]